MPKRTTRPELENVLGRKGYGIANSLGERSISATIGRTKLFDKAGGDGQVSILERSVGPKSIRPKDLTIPHSGRVFVRVKVFRQRLTDTGNDCWKYHLDACRYLGLLADDNDATIHLTEEPHEKVKTKEEERVEMTLTYEGLTAEDVVKYYESGPKNQDTHSLQKVQQ
jgi:hypothetical protein